MAADPERCGGWYGAAFAAGAYLLFAIIALLVL